MLVAATVDAVAAVAFRLIVLVISVGLPDGIATLLVFSGPCLLQWQRAPLLLPTLLPFVGPVLVAAAAGAIASTMCVVVVCFVC